MEPFKQFPSGAMRLAPRTTPTGVPAGWTLENINTTTLADGCLCWVQSSQADFRLLRNSVALPNGVTIIAPATGGPGRWLRSDGPTNLNPVVDTLTATQNISVWAGQGGGWHDIVGVPQTRTTGGTIPTLAQVGATIFWAHRFAINDEMWFAYHILHDYVVGSAIFCHVHWFPVGTAINVVRWEFSIVAAKGHQQEAFNLAAPTVVTVDRAPTGTSQMHYITEVANPGFSSASLEPDSIMWVRIRRITNGGVNNTDPIFLLLSDLHYQSNGSPTKNKAPNFYI